MKHHAPLPNGFVMTRHKPTKAAYGLLGADVSTEITFELPSTRFENIAGVVLGRSFDVIGLTVCTPLDAETTQVTQIFYWPAWMGFVSCRSSWPSGRLFPLRRSQDRGTPARGTQI